MTFRKQGLSIEEVKKIDLVDYLSSQGFQPSKIRNNDYWYLSPLRIEKTPSFKVNRKLNKWYDHGIGQGGNIIDFAIYYHRCSVGEFFQKIDHQFSFRSSPTSPSNQVDKESKIVIIKDSTLSTPSLIRYLVQRKIPYDISNQYCREIQYQLYGRLYYGIGFKNDSGGFEIRNPYFKTSSSPKHITTIDNGAEEATVFEGFVDFLSFMAIHKNQEKIKTDFVILNSVSFFEKARPFMEQHNSIRLYLDRDTTGQNYSRYALSLSKKYSDESGLYESFKDLNDWLVNFGKGQKENLRQKPR